MLSAWKPEHHARRQKTLSLSKFSSFDSRGAVLQLITVVLSRPGRPPS